VLLAAGLAAQRLMPGRHEPRRATSAAAAVLTASSVALAFTASARFRSQQTTVHPLHPERTSSLVTTGPNQVSRNPMYVGMVGVLVANALRLRSLPALGLVATFVRVMESTQIAAEERVLAEKFGPEYEAYTARVPRWLGRP
jgi:protein-S-isoprenylcysteine O-methyltransferase Ste14